MHAIVTLFDKKNDLVVKSLWRDLEKTFHVRGVYKTPYPHFSYQIASEYNVGKLESILERFARKSKPFTVQAFGLGVFTGSNLVLYIPVTRTLKLSKFHESLWKVITSTGSGVSPYYKTEFWMPHITLAQWDINERNLPAIIGRLTKIELSLEIKVDNLAIIFDDGKTQSVRTKFTFSYL
jgi:2'-5' RNA ligase